MGQTLKVTVDKASGDPVSTGWVGRVQGKIPLLRHFKFLSSIISVIVNALSVGRAERKSQVSIKQVTQDVIWG